MLFHRNKIYTYVPIPCSLNELDAPWQFPFYIVGRIRGNNNNWYLFAISCFFFIVSSYCIALIGFLSQKFYNLQTFFLCIHCKAENLSPFTGFRALCPLQTILLSDLVRCDRRCR